MNDGLLNFDTFQLLSQQRDFETPTKNNAQKMYSISNVNNPNRSLSLKAKANRKKRLKGSEKSSSMM